MPAPAGIRCWALDKRSSIRGSGVDDDISDVGDLLAQLLLELAAQLVSIDQGGLGADAEREEDDATGLGAKQRCPARLGARPLKDYALDLPHRVEVRARGGWAGDQRALQGLQVCLYLAHAGASADRLLDALSDRERGV